MKQWHLFYVLMTFSIGMATLGITAVASYKTQEKFLRYYLYFHIAFTLAVFSRMFFLYHDTSLFAIPPALVGIMEYVEGDLAKYALMFTIPLFLHEFIAFPQAKIRNRIVWGLIGVTAILELMSNVVGQNSLLPQSAHILKNAVFTTILLYTVAMGLYYSWQLKNPVKKKLAMYIIITVGFCLPGIIDELWFHSIFPLPVFPILYSSISIIFTVHLFMHVFGHAPALPSSPEALPEETPDVSTFHVSDETLFQHYNISPREQDVVNLVLAGRSNQEIADTLYVSLSTIKTHLRNIYQKVDVKSRYELIIRFKNPQDKSAHTKV
ncbi:putative two-component response regulator [Candidatus Vecturithrix granuli]|uniref:Putative two-component response regulator n=1 Tax=Vecturithrix granuli TaxID=1499967 RepID=A0A081C248_VECG1|nr:putative two-component response regulator [Candidatus Vecturithrix granuli]